jgi:hypothetical protein
VLDFGVEINEVNELAGILFYFLVFCSLQPTNLCSGLWIVPVVWNRWQEGEEEHIDVMVT